jgi:hypothetical protein
MPAIENLANRDAGPGASITRGELTGLRVIFSVDEEMDTIGAFCSNFNTNKSSRRNRAANMFGYAKFTRRETDLEDRKDNVETI